MALAFEIRVRGVAPRSGLARELWARGVRLDPFREQIEAWGGDVERAWCECEQPGLLLALAFLRRAEPRRVARVALEWAFELRRLLEGSVPGKVLAGELAGLVLFLHAPDPDRAALAERRDRLFVRGARGGVARKLLGNVVAGAARGGLVRELLGHLVGLHAIAAEPWGLHPGAYHAAELGALCLELLRAQQADAPLLAAGAETWRQHALAIAREELT